MNHKVCQRCAKEFHGQPWRVACDRCGMVVVPVIAESDGYVALYKARERAKADGWRENGRRYTRSGHLSTTAL